MPGERKLGEGECALLPRHAVGNAGGTEPRYAVSVDVPNATLMVVDGRKGTQHILDLQFIRSQDHGEIFERNLGKGSKLGIERGLNALWNKGGILYAPPIR